jgi:hypothetical protein
LALCARKLLLYVILCAVSACCHGEAHLVLCGAGLGSFSSKFSTGVTVTVDATKAGAFSTHTCEATLSWGKDVMPIVQDSWEIDIDVLGADLGLNTPVAAFQIKSAAQDHYMTYKVYSLERPPRLLRTIAGGDFFSAADINLEGRNEIWTNDARVVDGFEGLPLSSFDFAPTVVLRFEKQKLIDVSSEYRPYFDRQIVQLKSQLDEPALAAFKSSDGRLQEVHSLSREKLRLLQITKSKVMEIVWCYLYSGREEEAWYALAAMWPPADFDRIRDSMLDMQARGIRRQVDGVSTPKSHPLWKHHAQIYNMDTESKGTVDMASGREMAVASDMPGAGTDLGERTPYSVDVKPEPIYLGTPSLLSDNQPVLTSKIYLNLVIDAAGKVRSARLANESDRGPVGEMLLGSTTGWKFIPAFKDGRAVACRMRFGVWPYR